MLDGVLMAFQFVSDFIGVLFNITIPLTGEISIKLGSVFIFIFLIYAFIYLVKTLTNKSVVSSRKGG